MRGGRRMSGRDCNEMNLRQSVHQLNRKRLAPEGQRGFVIRAGQNELIDAVRLAVFADQVQGICTGENLDFGTGTNGVQDRVMQTGEFFFAPGAVIWRFDINRSKQCILFSGQTGSCVNSLTGQRVRAEIDAYMRVDIVLIGR